MAADKALGSGAEIEPVVGGGAYGDGNHGYNSSVWVCGCVGVWVLGSGMRTEPVVGGGAYGDGDNGYNNNTWVCGCIW